MDDFKKVGNVLGIVMAWLLSIALVIMLTVTPLALSALSLLDADTISKVVINTVTQSLLPGDTEDTAAYTLTRLSTGQMNASADGSAPAGEEVLEGMFGDSVSPEAMEKILSSNVAKEFIEAYTRDIVNAFTGKGQPQLDSELLKKIVNDNLDEVVELIREIAPELASEDTQKIKDVITKAVDEQAGALIEELPKPEELRNAMMESNPELETALELIARKNTIKLTIVGELVLVSGLIFLCRLPGMRGFRWLATDLFVGGGMNALLCVGLLLGASAVKQMVAGEPVIGGLVGSLLSVFTIGMAIRTAVMLAAAAGLLVAYIFIKKAQTKTALIAAEEP